VHLLALALGLWLLFRESPPNRAPVRVAVPT
jgi:hypothetical protein